LIRTNINFKNELSSLSLANNLIDLVKESRLTGNAL